MCELQLRTSKLGASQAWLQPGAGHFEKEKHVERKLEPWCVAEIRLRVDNFPKSVVVPSRAMECLSGLFNCSALSVCVLSKHEQAVDSGKVSGTS